MKNFQVNILKNGTAKVSLPTEWPFTERRAPAKGDFLAEFDRYLEHTLPKKSSTTKAENLPGFQPKQPVDAFTGEPFSAVKGDTFEFAETGTYTLNKQVDKGPALATHTETDPRGVALNTPGAKADNGKDRVWLCVAGFSNALAEVAKVTTVGANKYTPNGWVDVPNGQQRYMDAFGRHMLDLGAGATVDNGPGGTGCLHKAQMIWNLLASLELELRK